MHRSVTLAVLGAALVVPAAAQAGEPTRDDRVNAAQECRDELGTTAATREAFAAKYRNFGACVSKQARDEARERDAAKTGAAKTCKDERGTTAQSRKAFDEKYGTNANKRNAFGKCVSKAAKAAEEQADAADHDAASDRKSAAKQCAQERGTTAASRKAFGEKYGTNANGHNAFGKCVSKLAKAMGDD